MVKIMKNDKGKKIVHKRESLFATEAKEEAKGALKRYKSEKKRGLKVAAEDSKREVVIDNAFAKKRKKWAEQARDGKFHGR